MKLRDATLGDVGALACLVMDFCTEAGLPYHPKAIASLLVSQITSPRHYCRVADREGDIVGCFLGFVDLDVYNHDLFAQDRLMYIRPEWRDKTVSHRLYLDFLTWAKDEHCKYAVFQALCAKDNEQFARVLERLHCSRKGVLMIRYL